MKVLYKGLLFIGFLGTTLTLIIPIILIVVEQNVEYGYGYLLLGLPFIVFAWPYGIYKSVKENETKYGIRLWGAIKNVPIWMNLLIVVLFPVILITIIVKPKIGLLSILPFFNYISLLMYLSGIREK